MAPTEERELIELCARAVNFGNGKFCWTESEYPKGSGRYGALWNYVGHMDTAELFNPLHSKADCFDLMARLEIDVEFFFDHVVATGRALNPVAREFYGEDSTAATMLAVCRVAVEIAKGMK